MLACLALGGVGSGPASAAPGDLDPTFSGDGKALTDFGRSDGASGVARQADGKLVVAGNTSLRRDGHPPIVKFAVARYNPDGTLDGSFSGDGKQVTDFAGDGEQVGGVAVQGNGKIVVVGIVSGAEYRTQVGIVRYNPDGSLDTTFSTDGKQTTAFEGGDARRADLAVQRDGKLVVAGGVGHTKFALLRYMPSGALDPTFDGNGKKTTDFGTYGGASAVAVQGDGKIVAAGTGLGQGPDFAVARYRGDGSLDRSFSGDGKRLIDFGRRNDVGDDLAVQADGKILVVGASRVSSASPGASDYSDFALARLGPDGSSDASFSADGKQTTNFTTGSTDEATAVGLTPGGKIVLGGTTGVYTEDFALARYYPNGALDPAFSGDGKQTTYFSAGRSDRGGDLSVGPDGRPLLVGDAFGPNGSFDFALARFTAG